MEAREAMGPSGALPCDSTRAMWTSFEKFALLNMGRKERWVVSEPHPHRALESQ